MSTDTMTSNDILTASIDDLDRRIHECTLCTLGSKRTKAVPGNGSITADVMFIGEGPGYYEDQQGLPFVGRAGQLLNELLASVGMRREDVFVTNMIKCRAPNNRDPLPIEIKTCGPYLDRQIELIAPKVIVTLGRYSTAKFFPDQPIGKLRGVPAEWNGIVVFPMYHPAAALRNSNLRMALERDFHKLPELVENAGNAQLTTSTRAEAHTPQLGLLDNPQHPHNALADESAPASIIEPSDQTPRPEQLGLF